MKSSITLFALYTNDLVESVRSAAVYIYAPDNTSIYCIERGNVTSRHHGSKISGSQQ